MRDRVSDSNDPESAADEFWLQGYNIQRGLIPPIAKESEDMKATALTVRCASLLAVALFMGCAESTETVTDPPPSSDSADTVSEPAAQDATVVEESPDNAIPDDFPSDIYVADGQTTAELRDIGGKKNLILDYPASDEDEFIKGYQDGMAEKGWAVVASSKLPIGTLTNFSKDDRKCTVSIGQPEDGVIKVAIILSND